MPNIERLRDLVSEPPGSEYFQTRAREGWTLAAVEWRRETPSADQAVIRQEIPFGLQVASDCLHLEENPAEREQMLLMLDMIVEDQPLSRIADELNRRDYRTRSGARWTPAAVFDLLPRMIDTSPTVFASSRWQVRAKAH